MERIVSLACLIAGFAFFQINLFAWDGAGHMVIAAEAFRQLPPELKAQAFEVLKAHPDYEQWIKAYHPNPNIDLATYVFMRSSTWPDEIRRSGSPFDHPEWHFIDYPLRPPSFPIEPDSQPTNDVLFGVAQCEKTLSDTNADTVLRAVYLSFLIHLIGDMHQPLHCESFFSDAYPNGDRGGNDFYVRLDQGGVRLHGIWDGLLGTSQNPVTRWRYAFKIQVDYPRASLPELRKDTTPKEWSLESRKLAIEYGYLDGHLKGSTNAESALPLPEGYLRAAEAVAERRGALAGYRLTDEIETYLKFAGTLPLLPPNTNTVAQALPKEIGTTQAADYYDDDMVVTGRVVDVSMRSSIVLLNLDKPFPNSPFTAVIFDEDFGRFGDFQKYKGHEVEISGNITEYHDKPEMILESPREIKIIDPNPQMQ
ncbi:MAG TPA: S1/P1 nuclease [Candidatus Sulfotelmatobacter sp.]|nr:S1/P1 nuclease [Candidatus Sulfotelmatobacter sp.]